MYESSGAGRLKTLREQSGLTQQELSRQTGVSRSLISQWENGVIRHQKARRVLLWCGRVRARRRGDKRTGCAPSVPDGAGQSATQSGDERSRAAGDE